MKGKNDLIEKLIFNSLGSDPHDDPPLVLIPLYQTRFESSPFPQLVGFSRLTGYDFYSEKVSLASADGQYLLRIIKDTVNNQLQAHLLHQEKSGYQYVFICPENQRSCYLTDAHGQAQLKHFDLSELNLKLMPPAAVFEYFPLGVGQTACLNPTRYRERFQGSILQVELFRQDEEYVIKVKFMNPDNQLKARKMVLIKEGEEPLTSIPLKNMALFEVPARFIGSEKVQINIYG
jgi:hypothetical protein